MSITLSRSRSAIALVALCLVAGSAFAATAAPAGFDAQLLSIQQQWAHVNYELEDGNARDAAFEQLQDRAAGFANSASSCLHHGDDSVPARTRIGRFWVSASW